jgi:hypothetical protein
MTEALIYDAVRTPRGEGRRGALHSVKPVTPATGLPRAFAEQNRLDTTAVDDVVLGVVWPGLPERWTKPDDAAVPEQDIHDRLLFIQALQTVRVLDQGIVSSVADANIGSVHGIGFAPWTGGTLQLINAYGPQAFVARVDHLADAYGERFRRPATLRAQADRGECF